MDWFKNWFDSPYYHLLYKHRDTAEAQEFIDNILHYIQPESGCRILDLACGKGRHSIYLNQKGYDVVGVDLSKNSIQEAEKNANPTLHFYAMDMRDLTCKKPFDLVLNLFTSFGYFLESKDHVSVLKGVHNVLSANGLLVIDFLNANLVIQNLIPEEKQVMEGITFTINRFVENDYVVKKMEVTDGSHSKIYHERVRMFMLKDFIEMFAQSGFTLKAHFGDYQFHEFQPQHSERLIMVAQKN